MPLIKEVKTIVEGMNLVQVRTGASVSVLTRSSGMQAKKFVESAPQVLRSNVSQAEAEAMRAKLEGLGAVVEIE